MSEKEEEKRVLDEIKAYSQGFDSGIRRISELEKKFDTFRIKINDDLTKYRNIDNCNTKFNELEDLIQKIGVKLDFTSDEVSGANKGLAELEKSLKALGGFSNEHAESIVENMDELNELKEDHFEGSRHPTKVEYIDTLRRSVLNQEVLWLAFNYYKFKKKEMDKQK